MGKTKLGIYITAPWLIFSTYIYMDNLVHYPKSYVEYFNIRPLFDCFNSEEDPYRKEKALDYAKAHGKEVKAELLLSFGFQFVKPTFSLFGYLKLVWFPIICVWIILLLI